MPYQPKTNRKRGVIYSIVRNLASSKPRFTVDDLVPPLTRLQARASCQKLYEAGELRRVVKGFGGVAWRAAVYAKVNNGNGVGK